MFRASTCPSSGATTTAVAASDLPSELGDSSAVVRGRAYGSNNRTGLEDATNTTPHGNQRLHVQWGRLLMMDTVVSETCRAT
jgi:hypothetical protein